MCVLASYVLVVFYHVDLYLQERSSLSPLSNATFNGLSSTFTTPTTKVLTTSMPAVTKDEETLGSMSFATMEYLRRYHLLDSDELLDIPNLKLLPKLL